MGRGGYWWGRGGGRVRVRIRVRALSPEQCTLMMRSHPELRRPA